MADIKHSGLTYAQWQDRRIADYLAGRRDTLFEPHAFEREFAADADGCLDVHQILNTVTGEWVALPEPLRVDVDDIDRVVAEWQARFIAAWNTQHPDRAIGV
jgi:hypothetical protein